MRPDPGFILLILIFLAAIQVGQLWLTMRDQERRERLLTNMCKALDTADKKIKLLQEQINELRRDAE